MATGNNSTREVVQTTGVGLWKADMDLRLSFETFFNHHEPAVRRALVSGFGGEIGREATVVAFGRSWQDWNRISGLDNPAGYVFRIGQNWAKGQVRNESPVFSTRTAVTESSYEPGLADALASLSMRQRQAVVLVTGFGVSYRETAELLGLSRSSVQSHVERALKSLRHALGVS